MPNDGSWADFIPEHSARLRLWAPRNLSYVTSRVKPKRGWQTEKAGRREEGRALAHQFGPREVRRLSSELRLWRRSLERAGERMQARRPVMTERRACEEERTRHMKEAHSSFLGFVSASLWIMLSSALLMKQMHCLCSRDIRVMTSNIEYKALTLR